MLVTWMGFDSAIGPGSVALRLAFVALLGWAAVTDVRARCIPNVLTGTLLALGLLGACVTAASGAGIEAMKTAGLALGLGCAIWGTIGSRGWVAWGDVKLFMAASAWLTPIVVLNASAWTALLGGVTAVYWWASGRAPGVSLSRLRRATRDSDILRQPLPTVSGGDGRIPYGIPMVVVLMFEAARLWSAG